ncbi:MAG: hypothetical protein V3V01_02845 [Acidimicrobiales bacterium]
MGDFDDVEHWFVKQGLPHAIHNYSASTDVLTRAAPLLSLVFLLEATASFGDRFKGWAQFAVLLGAIAILLAAVGLLNRFRGRSIFALPDDIGALEVGLFLFGPALLPLLFGTHRASGFVLLSLLNLGILTATYVVVSFGLVPMFRTGAAQIAREVGGLGRLMLRSLPLLLLFATFLFLNAEMWQVAHEFSRGYYAISVGLLGSIAFAFLAFRIPSETASLSGFDSWDEITERAYASGAPVAELDRPWLADPPATDPLRRVDRINIGALLFVRQAAQVLLVAMVIGVFYVVFGLFTVREETIVQWTGLTTQTFDQSVIYGTNFLGSSLALTWELLAVSGFIAAFSALQFAVSLVTDSSYRDEFFAEAADEVRDVLAVRALYRSDIYRESEDS